MKASKFLRWITAATALAALSACGGGGTADGNASTSGGSPSTTPQQDPVGQASSTLVAQTGAAAVPGTTATAQAFDLTADIGDTWRLVLNQSGSFTLKVLSTQYGLTDISGTFTAATSGSFTTFTGTSSNGSFSLKLDTRTHVLTGAATVDSKSAGVSGSGYSVPLTTKLAGDYFYLGETHDAGNDANFSIVGGTFRIATDGTTMTLCDGGLLDASGSSCTAPAGSSNQTSLMSLQLALNTSDGLTHVQINNGTQAAPSWVDFGILSFQAGDRGPVLTIDRYGNNQATPPVLRTGAIYAAKQQVLTGAELNGSWNCIDRGQAVGTLSISGTSLTATPAGSTANPVETLAYNNVDGDTPTQLTPTNGVVADTTTGVLILPLSSSMFVVERDAQHSVAVCH